jgi:hypothetical protein
MIVMLIGLLLIRINELLSNALDKFMQLLAISVMALIPIVTFVISLGFAPQRVGATFNARTDYWRAAWNLILENPLIGKGFDSFGDWYLFYRDQRAVDTSPGLFTDSTHNLILELGVFGGLPLLVLYLILQGLALKSALKITISNGNLQSKVIVVAWIGFNLQSAISPSSLALVALGFIFTGVVRGAGRDLARKQTPERIQNRSKTRQAQTGVLTKVMVSTFAVSISGTGIYLGATPILKDAHFRDAIEQGNGQRMFEVSRQWPFNFQVSRQSAIILKTNGYDELALVITREMVVNNAYNIQGWKLLYDYSTVTSERSSALKKMRELDPLNPEILKLVP